MQPNNVVDDDHRDDIVDQIIRNCLDQDNPRSFFLFAGAGSGKTKSLIDALNFFLDKYGHQFMELRRNIAVITYTNAACDEIKEECNIILCFKYRLFIVSLGLLFNHIRKI